MRRNDVEGDISADAFLNRGKHSPDATLNRVERQLKLLEARVQEAVRQSSAVDSEPVASQPEQVSIWGVPFSRMRLPDVLRYVDDLLRADQPRYFITANLNYCMLSDQNQALQTVNQNAAFIVCDGMPIVWRSLITRTPLPERVAGSELIYALTQWAAHRGYRVFFLGGALAWLRGPPTDCACVTPACKSPASKRRRFENRRRRRKQACLIAFGGPAPT